MQKQGKKAIIEKQLWAGIQLWLHNYVFQQWKSSENREYDMKQTVHWVDAKTWIDKSLAEDSLGFTFKQWIICNWSSTFHWKQLFYVNKSKIDHSHTGHIWAPRLMLQKEEEIENLKDW